MINFIGSEAQIGHAGTDKNITTTQQKTGYEGDNDILKNIYDLEGNNLEWTAEAFSRLRRVGRGGNYSLANSGCFYPASHSEYSISFDPTCSNDDFTARLSLYL